MSKKIYIYEHLEKITTNFHGDGGVVVVTAGDPSEAWLRRKIIKSEAARRVR